MNGGQNSFFKRKCTAHNENFVIKIIYDIRAIMKNIAQIFALGRFRKKRQE